MNVIHCPHCGTTNRAGSNFCNRCGANLRSDEPQDEASDQPSASSSVASGLPAAGAHADTAFDDLAEQTEDFGHGDPNGPSLLPTVKLPEATDWLGPSGAAEPPPLFPPARRLVTGVQGLLDPVQIASELEESTEAATPIPSMALPFAIHAEQLRRIRTLLTDDPVLLDTPLPAGQPPVRLHIPWLILLLSLAIAVPIVLDLFGPVGAPQQWPGVAEAHAVIDALPVDATALVLWEYDAATAAELDLVALPLVSHLLERRIQPIIVSQLPGGPAVADRLFKRAIDGLRADTSFRLIIDRELYVNAGYLPGGAAILSFIAQAPAQALGRHSPVAPGATPLDSAAMTPALLTLVVAAQAEAVQQWLEQGQPLQGLPTLAFTSAGADPILRPYLASGQLHGLVSGFDGAMSYQKLRTVHLAAAEEVLLDRQLVLQNWGHFALLLLLLLGNLAAWGRGRRRG